MNAGDTVRKLTVNTSFLTAMKFLSIVFKIELESLLQDLCFKWIKSVLKDWMNDDISKKELSYLQILWKT